MHFAEATIHDFQGNLTLNGGRYRLPFSIPLPPDMAPSFEISPVEGSLLEVFYQVEVTVTEKPDAKAKKSDKLVHGGVPLISNSKPITIFNETKVQSLFNTKHTREHKATGLGKIFK